ncbi:MAG: aromatic aminobenezylarsenical efflux permease ArsG family transporter [Armatimonadota bacterium]
MELNLLSIISALWLGILTSISPCPLASNIAAVSFIGRRITRPAYVFMAGLLYSLGRVISYSVLGILITAGALSVPGAANFLQKYMNILLGPILIITGIILLGVFKISFTGFVDGNRIKGFAEKWGIWGALLLGIIFALAFCPVSAALFFGSIIPMSIEKNSPVLLPCIYGIGTGLPVIFFALIIALSVNSIGRIYNKINAFEVWARRVTAVILIAIGIYYLLSKAFNLF